MPTSAKLSAQKYLSLPDILNFFCMQVDEEGSLLDSEGFFNA